LYTIFTKLEFSLYKKTKDKKEKKTSYELKNLKLNQKISLKKSEYFDFSEKKIYDFWFRIKLISNSGKQVRLSMHRTIYF